MYLSNKALLQYSSHVNGTIIFDILLYISLCFFKCEKTNKTKVFLSKEDCPVFHLSYNPQNESLSIWEVDHKNCSEIVNPSFFSETINFRLLEKDEYDLSDLVFSKLLLIHERIEKFCSEDSSNRFIDKLCRNNKRGEKLRLCLKAN